MKSNRPFAANHSCGTKPPRWKAKVALGQDKQKTYIIWNGNFLCLSCPSATFALQHGGFVPREWLAAKGLLSPLILGNQATFLLRISAYFWRQLWRQTGYWSEGPGMEHHTRGLNGVLAWSTNHRRGTLSHLWVLFLDDHYHRSVAAHNKTVEFEFS